MDSRKVPSALPTCPKAAYIKTRKHNKQSTATKKYHKVTKAGIMCAQHSIRSIVGCYLTA